MDLPTRLPRQYYEPPKTLACAVADELTPLLNEFVSSCTPVNSILGVLQLQLAVLVAVRGLAADLCFPSGRRRLPVDPRLFHVAQSPQVYGCVSSLVRALRRSTPVTRSDGNLLDFLDTGSGNNHVRAAVDAYRAAASWDEDKKLAVYQDQLEVISSLNPREAETYTALDDKEGLLIAFLELPVAEFSARVRRSRVESERGKQTALDTVAALTHELRRRCSEPLPERFYIGDPR